MEEKKSVHTESVNDYEIETFESFDDMGLDENLLRGIYAYGFEYPSNIQKKAIKPVIDNNDIVAQSQSGTGKTGTFIISSLQKVDPEEKSTQVLILSPTRELASQSYEVAKKISSYTKITISLIVGGKSIGNDFSKLDKGSQIIIGTPGRVFDMLKRYVLRSDKIKLLVIDEADEMLSSGFKEQVYDILQYIPQTSNIGLFSATISQDILDITSRIMKKPLRILVKNDDLTLEGIRQFYVFVNNEHVKYEVLKELYSSISISQTIIYCNSKRKATFLAEKLSEEGFTISCIHSDMVQNDRDKVVKSFRNGSTRILIATDIIARGIDVQQVSVVINYDIPKYRETYIHRIGRSGRYGKRGCGINFVNSDELTSMREIEKFYNTQIVELPANFDELI